MRESGEIKQVGTPEQIYALGKESLLKHQLKSPFTEQLKLELAARDIPVPKEYLTDERMAKWLWVFVLNK